MSQLPFGWVCFSNDGLRLSRLRIGRGLNCLSAGSVSLTPGLARASSPANFSRLNCLSAGSVSLTWRPATSAQNTRCLNCLSAGSVSLTPQRVAAKPESGGATRLNCLSAGSVSLTKKSRGVSRCFPLVSIAFRLGLFL